MDGRVVVEVLGIKLDSRASPTWTLGKSGLELSNQNMADHSFTFKIVVIGDKGVGKSSLIRRFHNDTFDDKLPTTIGVDFFIHDLAIAGKTVKVGRQNISA